MKEKIGVIIALTVIIGTCFSVYFYFEDRYALSAELKATQQRLEYKIVSDQLKATQERIWTIEDRSGKIPQDKTTREELNQLNITKEELKDKLKAMEKK